MVRPMEVSMKMIADQVVSLVRRLAAPRGPKAVVCDPSWPPKGCGEVGGLALLEQDDADEEERDNDVQDYEKDNHRE